MSELSDWSDLIRRQGEESRAREEKRLDAMEAALPRALEDLSQQSNKNLVELMLQHHGSAYWPRETALRLRFHDACKEELLRRLGDD